MTLASLPSHGHAAPLYSLVYMSRAVEPLDDAGLHRLLTASREANGGRGITGLLLYRNSRFVQFLEGEEEPVRDLLSRISADTRHTDVRVLLDGRPRTRQFAEWTMAYQPVKEPTSPAPPGFRSTFDDLEAADDADHVLRATRELSIWFRVRSARNG